MKNIVKSYKQYLKIRKMIMMLTKIYTKLATAAAQLFIIIGILFTLSEIVDRISTKRYLKEYEAKHGQTDEDNTPKKTRL